MNRSDVEELGEVFRQFSWRMRQEWGKQSEHGISRFHVLILRKLQKDGPLKVSDMADKLSITAGAVTGLSDKLISYGYAERERSEADRRVVYLNITPKGEHILQSLGEKTREQMRTLLKELFTGVSDEDVRHLKRIFKQIQLNLEKSTS